MATHGESAESKMNVIRMETTTPIVIMQYSANNNSNYVKMKNNKTVQTTIVVL
jgi:hypothetical protein